MHDLEERSLARLTIPHVLTPAQYYGGRRIQHPETHAMKRLLLAVLEDALRCLQTYAETAIRPIERLLARPRPGFWIARLTGRSLLKLFVRL